MNTQPTGIVVSCQATQTAAHRVFKPQASFRPGWIILLLTLVLSMRVMADVPTIPTGDTNDVELDSWSFNDTNYWTSDFGYYPISFTNLSVSYIGPGNSLLIDTNTNAWLQFNVYETNGSTNLNIVSAGSVMFWYAPNWASTNDTNDLGTTGPGVASRFLEVGTYTSNATYGWWSLYMDSNGNNIYFSSQDAYGDESDYLSAPVTFTSNVWHLIALTWTSTNTSLYVDGTCLTNGPGISALPSSSVLSNGFTIGSDGATGLLQMHGAMNSLTSYNWALDSGTIGAEWVLGGIFYSDPYQLGNFTNASYYPLASDGYLDVVGGPGLLQVTGTNTGTNCGIFNSEVWITNVFYTTNTNSSINLGFMVAGGNPAWAYDVFGIGKLPWPKTNGTWTWLGQAYQCQTNLINGLTNQAAFIILGTPQDSDGDGLTDAYELLVTHSNPYSASTLNDGIPDGWKVMYGFSPTNSTVSTNDPDKDGLSNLQEYLYGTNPQVSQGFNVWVANPAGITGIP